MTPTRRSNEAQHERRRLDRQILLLGLLPWLVAASVVLAGAPPRAWLGVVAAAVLGSALAVAIRSRCVPASLCDAALAEQAVLFDQLGALQGWQVESDRRLLLALQDGSFGVWEYDPLAKKAFFSPGFREQLGIETGDFTGDLEWFEARVQAAERSAWREAMRSHLENRTPYALEVHLRIASGDYRLFRACGQAAWDAAGRPVRLSGSLKDITERQFTEQRLRESEESFRSLSAASPIGILKADANGECVWCNDRWQEISGMSEFEALGVGWLGAVHPEDVAAVTEAWRGFVREAGPFDKEFRIRRGDDDVRHARSRANSVLDDQGAVVAFVATVEDVTQERLAALAVADARDRAMRAAQAKSEFLANMSHEIRTPLNGVIGMAELLQGTALDPEQRDILNTINGSAESLLGIINDILDYSKIEAGKMRLECLSLDLRTIAEDVAEMLAPIALERALELVVAVDPEVPRRVLGDPTRLRQILTNLTSNALKFTEKGSIVISVTCVARTGGRSRVKLAVRDTGIGIPAHRLDEVFESFTQADGSTTRKYGGTGLGLTICRQLARLMDGDIHVTSEVGVGSEFWVEVVLGVGSDPGPADGPTRDLAGVRVLVADDHPINRRILAETLAGWGMFVEVVESGDQALARIGAPAAEPFDIVLLDYRMPGLDGLETAGQMRDMPGAETRAVLVLSSSGGAIDLAGLRQHGVRQWLTKPVRAVALERAIASALGRTDRPRVGPRIEPPAREFTGLSLLLVEDNEVNQKVALRMLQRLGCAADVAVNGLEGVERAGAREYDLVFMDCQMPEMDGFEATREIRRRERETGRRVRIVAMTANALEGDRERCLAAGMDDYVAKPIKLENLAEHLRVAFTLRRAA